MTTVGDRLFEMGGIPVGGGSKDLPIFGDVYIVDGTNGLDSNTGLKPDQAKKTIQSAVTKQIAYSTGLGDVIYVMPGTYAESITGTLTDVSLVGVGPTPYSVIVAPTTAGGYVGTLTRSAIRNIQFRTPSTSNTAHAAVALFQMNYSVVDNCQFMCVTNVADSMGFQIGTPGGTAVNWEHMYESTLSNSLISTVSGRTTEPKIGIAIGNAADTGGYAYRQLNNSRIFGNIIRASTYGIKVDIASTNGNGGLISHNDIGSQQNYGYTSGNGILQTKGDGDDDRLTKIHFNTVAATSDAIVGFTTGNVMGNIVSLGAATPTGETGFDL